MKEQVYTVKLGLCPVFSNHTHLLTSSSSSSSSSSVFFCFLLKAKKLVEDLPQTIKRDINKEEAEKIKAALEEIGGSVEIA